MSSRTFRIVLVTLVLIFSFLPRAFALYSWYDKNGIFHISDTPPPGMPVKEAPKEEERAPSEQPAAPAPEQAPVQKQTLAPPPAAAKPSAAAPATPTKPSAPAPATPTAPPKTFTPPPASPAPAASQPPSASPAPPAAPAPASQPEQGVKSETPASARETSQSSHKVPPPAVLATLIAAFMGVFLFIFVAAYIYFSLCLYLIAKKLHPDNAWMAWVPIVQMASFVESAGKSLVWIIFLFIPLVNIVIMTYLWMCIAENVGKNRLLGLLTLVPIANLIVMGMFAFSKDETGQAAPPVAAA